MKRYRFLIFDADGTLFDYASAEIWAFRKMCEDLSIEYSRELHDTYRSCNHEIWQEFEQRSITLDRLKVERFARTFELLDLSYAAEKASSTYLYRLSQSDHLIEGTRELLESLRGRYRMALLTNGITDTQKGRLKASSIGEYFDPVIISEERGYQKPDPRIFEILFREAHDPNKHESLMIGDSLSSDIAGGKAFGIDTCLLDLEHRYQENDQTVRPDRVVHHLKELQLLLS